MAARRYLVKFLVAVDAEGHAGVIGEPGKTLSASKDFEFAKRQSTREADAAVRALFDKGAEQVIVWDNHNGSLNLDYDALDERCDLLIGVGWERRLGILDETFSGLLMIGYHPMEGTIDGVLAHSYSSVRYQYLKVNGRQVGEIAIDAALAGERGVPVIFLSSDDKAVAEAREIMPWIGSVTTKRALGRNMALSMHPRRSAAAVYDEVGQTVSRLAEMKPFRFASPITYELRFQRADAAEAISRSGQGFERVDGFTVSRTVSRISELY
jgi:D-amino peptidase